ncbi:putative ribonuclease VapC4 protein [Marine Group I thaumarchaeote SCGC AAA799-E16]|uniref:Putative ribonuclease VapC4 protein n=2 Tax=Marine Group I TaxID=905826 RepID=A0A087S4C4_9ARCH|nr:putative ribonuclease VapC4 protein [Marine Group I thaumarchaeote SCGC AAA799-E16]KFM20578.1 putative ribonuclease VapC4 protein [Marine Group I thaumarchaeote SCGC RSA3]
MVEVICDTSFLINLATRRIKNIDSLDVEIGTISFVVPEVVKTELLKLHTIPEKKHDVEKTLDFIKNLKTIQLSGSFADKELLEFAKSNKSIIGTMDKELKKQIKHVGGSILSFSNDKIILES